MAREYKPVKSEDRKNQQTDKQAAKMERVRAEKALEKKRHVLKRIKEETSRALAADRRINDTNKAEIKRKKEIKEKQALAAKKRLEIANKEKDRKDKIEQDKLLKAFSTSSIGVYRIDKLLRLPDAQKMTRDEFINYKSWQQFELEYDITKRVKHAIFEVPNIIRPEPPKDYTSIPNYHKSYNDQVFPKYSKAEITHWELRMDENHPEFDLYIDFITEEWRRRKEGYFFFNGGELTYITGSNYMFLQYWTLKASKMIGDRKVKFNSNPYYLDMHRDIFYAIKAAKDDKAIGGVILFSGRRKGKTELGISDGYFDVTSMFDQKMIIQSKSQYDGEVVYGRVVQGWTHIPKFFKPKDNKNSKPAAKLDFSQARETLSVDDREVSKGYLGSTIAPATSSRPQALDSQDFQYMFIDEVGKPDKTLDVNERHNINIKCIADDDDVAGFMYVTSTIEDAKFYASDKAELLWNRSSLTTLDDKGRTETLLRRIFIPHYYGYRGTDFAGVEMVDRFGKSNITAAYKYITRRTESLKGDDKLSFKRKNPIEADDMFVLGVSLNNFSKENLHRQREHNTTFAEGVLQRGNFIWAGGIKDSTVDFYPDKDGRWEVSWIPPVGDRNKYEIRGGQDKYPTRDYIRIGVDPFDQSFTVDKGSNASALVGLKDYALDPKMSKAVVCHYLYRPQHPEELYDDIIKMAVFYSAKVLAERNKGGLLEEMRKRGYNGYAMKDPLETDQRKRAMPIKGIPMSGDRKRTLAIESLQAFIYDHVGFNPVTQKMGWNPHDESLLEAIKFNVHKWTIYDTTVSWMMLTLALAGDIYQRESEAKETKIGDWHRKFKQ